MSGIYFPRVIGDIGAAGVQLTTLEATEGSAGNISIYARDLRNLDEAFVARGELDLPEAMPELADAWIIVTGTGRRLRDISASPEQSVVVLHVLGDGARATCYAAADLRPSSEWNSHLAVHADHVGQG